jgi:hypothetical protein
VISSTKEAHPVGHETLADTPGSKIFDGLTCDELDIVMAKLSAGAVTAARVDPLGNHDFHNETYETLHDLNVAWSKQFAAGLK